MIARKKNMKFSIEKALEILQNTPNILDVLLAEISYVWIENNEGENSWSPHNVVAHLVYGEKTHWISRVRTILAGNENQIFKLFNGSTQFSDSKGKSISVLIAEFKLLRNKNVNELKSYNISEQQLLLRATHPEFGKVPLKQLLSAWVVHDLNHIKQITRVMARQYQSEMGPWIKYIKI